MWSNGVALASKTSVKASARLCRKLQRCTIPRCFSLATKVMHIINPYTCNTLRRFVHVYMDFRSSTGRLNVSVGLSTLNLLLQGSRIDHSGTSRSIRTSCSHRMILIVWNLALAELSIA